MKDNWNGRAKFEHLRSFICQMRKWRNEKWKQEMKENATKMGKYSSTLRSVKLGQCFYQIQAKKQGRKEERKKEWERSERMERKIN